MLTVVRYRRGAPGGKLKMTLGLPVYVTSPISNLESPMIARLHSSRRSRR